MKFKSIDEIILLEILNRLKYFKWNRTHASDSLKISIRGIRLHIATLRRMGIRVPESKENLSKETMVEISKDVFEEFNKICENSLQ